MNIEVLKQLADVFGQLKKDESFIGLHDNKIHAKIDALKGKENLQFRSRGGSEYPFEISTEIEGVKIFALAKSEELVDFPQFKEDRKAELKKQLAVLEAELKKEEEATA
jgi:CRISPR/Cas system-associated exonuclease Cas4 (RecB family)